MIEPVKEGDRVRLIKDYMNAPFVIGMSNQWVTDDFSMLSPDETYTVKCATKIAISILDKHPDFPYRQYYCYNINQFEVAK